MHNPHHPNAPPMRNGVGPSCVALPHSGFGTMLEFLAKRLPTVGPDVWRQRMADGDVLDEHGVVLTPGRCFEPGLRLYYYRDLPDEPVLPFEEKVLYQDAHLLVADKPHFMPVTPSGQYLQSTLLVRLRRRLDLPQLAPVHRIDRDTAGLVLFSVQPSTRGAYHALFRDRSITKTYGAVAPWRRELEFPMARQSRLEKGTPFFRTQEVAGPANSLTHIDVEEVQGAWARYRLNPVTGKRHQLRVHMDSLGLPLMGDGFYPVVNDPEEGDWSNPLQLLARSIEFTDPVTGELRRFESQRSLRPLSDFNDAGV